MLHYTSNKNICNTQYVVATGTLFNQYSFSHKSSQYLLWSLCSHDTDCTDVADKALKPPIPRTGIIGLSETVFVDAFMNSTWKFSTKITCYLWWNQKMDEINDSISVGIAVLAFD
jgi:hypothetical protein